MVSFADGVFKLTTADTSYWFRITKFGHLEQIYYGALLPDDQLAEPLLLKRTSTLGSSVNYDPDDDMYCMDNLCLVWSGIGMGDYRNTPAEIKMPDGTFSTDFTYQSHKITNGNINIKTLPSSFGSDESCKTLELTMQDKSNEVSLLLYYTVYIQTNVITRRAEIIADLKDRGDIAGAGRKSKGI